MCFTLNFIKGFWFKAKHDLCCACRRARLCLHINACGTYYSYLLVYTFELDNSLCRHRCHRRRRCHDTSTQGVNILILDFIAEVILLWCRQAHLVQEEKKNRKVTLRLMKLHVESCDFLTNFNGDSKCSNLILFSVLKSYHRLSVQLRE